MLGRIGIYVWTAPNTAVGFLLGLLSFQVPRLDDGVVVFDRSPRGFLWSFGLTGFRAITFGHVVLSRVPLAGHHRLHERAHVRQYEVLGPLYLPAYVVLWTARGYRRHPFELAASRAAAVRRAGPPEGRA
jgi:hypothetical protein